MKNMDAASKLFTGLPEVFCDLVDFALRETGFKVVRDSLQQAYFDLQPSVETTALKMTPEQRQQYLNSYSVQQAQQMLARWKQLAIYLIVKHNDMAVKPEENGRFTRTKHGLGAAVKRPGYPKPFAR